MLEERIMTSSQSGYEHLTNESDELAALCFQLVQRGPDRRVPGANSTVLAIE